MPAAYQSAPLVLCHSVQAGTATTMNAESIRAAWKSCAHMRMPWKTVWPPRSVLAPRPRISRASRRPAGTQASAARWQMPVLSRQGPQPYSSASPVSSGATAFPPSGARFAEITLTMPWGPATTISVAWRSAPSLSL